MLLGLALIAVPLLVAVVDAAIQIRSLTKASQALVLEGVQAARLSQSMFADIASLAAHGAPLPGPGRHQGARQLSPAPTSSLAGTRAQLACAARRRHHAPQPR